MNDSIQSLCAQGQDRLLETDYLGAEAALMQAEKRAWIERDWDALSRLYMPLQEARRQKRQRAIEGAWQFCTRLETPDKDQLRSTGGHVLLAGVESIDISIEARREFAESRSYVDVFLAAAYQFGSNGVILIVPAAAASVPKQPGSIDALLRNAPPHSILLPADEIQPSEARTSDATGAWIMTMWERLHQPFLAAADACTDPILKIELYRKTIEVDYACELAHQHISAVARGLRNPAAIA